MKHTPGPWTITEFTNTSTGLDISHIESSKGWANSGMAGKRTVAEIGHWKDRPNPEHDAKLIAAAPELLEALKITTGLLAGHKRGQKITSGQIDRALHLGRQAQIKATS